MEEINTNHRLLYIAFVAVIFLVGTFALADDIYVTSGDTIKKIDSAGNATTFASGVLSTTGFASDGSGNLYTTHNFSSDGYPDDWYWNIYKYDSTGNSSVFATGSLSFAYGHAWTYGLTVRGSRLYMGRSPDNPGVVVKYNLNGNYEGIFTETSDGIGINDLAFDGSGNLYMTSLLAGPIFKSDPSGNSSVFASVMNGDNYATGYLAVDIADNLYMANCEVGTILKFDSDGNSTIFASGLTGLFDLAFDSSGYLYATCNGSILKFDSSGNNTVFASGIGAGFITIIPEPASIVLLSLGVIALRQKKLTFFLL